MPSLISDRHLRAALNPVRRALAMLAARAVVRLVDDSTSRQTLQAEILKDELRDGVERVQDYGFTSHPFAGSDAVIICAGGRREQSIAIVVDDRRYRMLLQEGEVAIYDDLGQFVALRRARIHAYSPTEIKAEAPTVRVAATDVIIDATTTTLNSNLDVVGNTTFTGTVKANGKSIDDTHKHTGVSVGTGVSGTPQ